MLNSRKVNAVNCPISLASNYSKCSNPTEKMGPDFSPKSNARNIFQRSDSKTKKLGQVNP